MFRSQFKDKYVASLYGLSFEEYKDKLFEATVAQTRGKDKADRGEEGPLHCSSHKCS